MKSFVEVKDLIVQTHIGCGEDERQNSQNLNITIKAHFDIKYPNPTESLENTVDYVQLREIALNLSAEKPRKLLETLAFDICNQIFRVAPLVEKINIVIQKFSTAAEAKSVGFGAIFKREKMEKIR